MKSIWTGAIGFGLVNIPVKLYGAVEASTLDLDMLDAKDHANIQFKRVNANTGREVNWQNIVKGYKVDGEYVILTDEDFDVAGVEKSKTIVISDFVKEDDIDSIYYETPYYVEPDKSGERAYSLLQEALLNTGKVGIATFVMRSRENLAVLRAREDLIILNKIRFAEEIRESAGLAIPPRKNLKKGELELAVSLIDQLTGEFDIAAYQDTYTDSLLKLIRAKAKGIKTKAPHLKVVRTKSTDLMAQLKASLGARKKAS